MSSGLNEHIFVIRIKQATTEKPTWKKILMGNLKTNIQAGKII